jgi:hypothetical protein
MTKFDALSVNTARISVQPLCRALGEHHAASFVFTRLLMTHGTTTRSITHTRDKVGSAEMCPREGELVVPRVDGVVRDGWAHRRATNSPSAQHDDQRPEARLVHGRGPGHTPA